MCLVQRLASSGKWIGDGQCYNEMCVGTVVSMEHCSRSMENCSRSMEHYSRSMEHCSKREGVLQGHEDRSPVRGPALGDATVDGDQQTGTEVWNLRAGLCVSGI